MTASDRLTHSALLDRILASSREIADLDPTLGAAMTGEDGVSLALVITPGGAIGLHEDGEYLKGDVNLYHNIHRRLYLPPHAAPEDIAEWVGEHAPEIVTVCEGMGQSWNDHNMVGTLTTAARDALTALDQAAEDLAPDLPRVLLDPEIMFDGTKDELEDQATEEEAVALAVQWGREAETEHGTDAVLVVDYDLVRRYAAQVWQNANNERDE